MPNGTTTRQARPATLITCGGCDATWTAQGAAHCAASGCHRTFSAAGLFDKHRSTPGEHGRCLDPATLTARDGSALFEFRDGMWRGPEMTDEAKAARFGDAA